MIRHYQLRMCKDARASEINQATSIKKATLLEPCGRAFHRRVIAPRHPVYRSFHLVGRRSNAN